MNIVLVYFVVLVLVTFVCETQGLSEGGTNVLKKDWYTKERYQVKCHFWHWGRCTKYRNKYHYYLYCKSGWTSEDRSDCSFAYCDSLTNRRGACHIYYPYDEIRRRDGTKEKSSGGNCYYPERCKNCNDGFYADGPKCRICPTIDHCNHRVCNNIFDNHCKWCDGDIIEDKKSWRAYIPYPSNTKKTCQKACSWRADSTRCFPGSCTEELAAKCHCWNGFGGHHCDHILIDVDVKYAEAKLLGGTKILTTPIDPNDPGPQPIRWTNYVSWNKIEIEFHTKLPDLGNQPDHDPTGDKHYVTDFRYGIIKAQMELKYDDGNIADVLDFICYSNENSPLDHKECSEKGAKAVDISKWQFHHSHSLKFTWSVTNGGYLTYIDREAFRTIRVSLKGRTLTRGYMFKWDLVKPYHSCLPTNNCLTSPPIETTDVTETSQITVTWNGWLDDLAGVEHYTYEVFKLYSNGIELQPDSSSVKEANNISASNPMATFTLPSPGMYSVTVAVYDRAQNYKATRCLIFYDDQSKVETQLGKTITVEQSSKDTNYKWVTVSDKILKVTWQDKFINTRHKQNHWLSGAASLSDVEDKYDDHVGKRTIYAVPNAHGVVRFEIQYQVFSPTLSANQIFTPTLDVEAQNGEISVQWNDGDRLDITVRAIDIFEKYMDEIITVYKDTSTPNMDNLWLTHGDHVNISVHSIADFSKMTIEWDAVDYDSGLNQVEWRLFNNYTSSVVLHGKAELHAQGMAQNLTHCEQKYKDEPRGPSCYCTMFHGCYHKHFYVIPKISEVGKLAGLAAGKEKGVHDSDYYIEVTVINNALLKTIVSKKITIDVSPPHEGTVHDGIRGQPEVDYQQDMRLATHWEGFFDRESGVAYYEYIFYGHCLSNKEFADSSKLTKTYDTYASFLAPEEGTYIVSVVAVNRANERSNVVCSDGVTIMTNVPFITNLDINGAKTRNRLVVDTGKVWLIDTELKKHLVVNTTLSCSVPSMNTTLFPMASIIASVDSTLCDLAPLDVVAVIIKTAQFKLSWTQGISDHFIHDYEIGLSSTFQSNAPDIVPFRSTRHHCHYRLNHPDVPDGKLFYVIIKTISKSGVEGVQSLGPVIVDTTSPKFTGTGIDVRLNKNFLIANWSRDAFADPDDPYPMDFSFAIGHQPNLYDVQQFSNLQYGGECEQTVPATCTVLDIDDLKWSLHGHHNYYFTIKATNLAGLSTTKTSVKYCHDVQLPAKGLVFDVRNDFDLSTHTKDIVDVDFATETTMYSVAWSNFVHPHEDVSFVACIGSSKGVCDVTTSEIIKGSRSDFTFMGIGLTSFKTYFATIEASTTAGSVRVSSDGLTIIDIHMNLTGVLINDGNNCSNPELLFSSHHEQDTRPKCDEDIDFQTSITSLHSYWSIPENLSPFIREAFVKVEERINDFWMQYRDYEIVGNHQYVTLNELNLEPGKTYRIVIKFCSEDFCFPTVYSNGVMVLVNPPLTGDVKLDILNGTNQISVTFEAMYDPDIADPEEAIDVVNLYEWAIGDNVGVHTSWNVVQNMSSVDITHNHFFIDLNTTLDFSKCRKVFIRGYNRAGIWAKVTKEIKKCVEEEGDSLIYPNTVIDAIGEQEYSLDGAKRDGYGGDINLEENGEQWLKTDVDYTPFKNLISATWPLLRHKNFTWAVIDAENLDVTSYYKDENRLKLADPCSHPDSIKCGKTDKNYVNAFFNPKEELEHGKRYIVCIHAPRREIIYEKWIEVLDEVKTCSDGVTIDLTPPTPGHVWIGVDPKLKYQSSTSDIFVSWESFTDVEEYGKAVHNSGIKEYFVGIGSTEGGTDIVPFTSVGLVNHYTFHGLHLQSGNEYYTTVKGVDFASRSSVATSHPVKIDNSPPSISKHPITIEGRHLSQMNEINACWIDVFQDTESGIDHYQWAVGSYPGHDDIIPFTRTLLDCGISAEDKNIDIHEGHLYFLTVKAVNRAKLISTASSWAYIFDMSKPIPGHVYDGKQDSLPSYSKDIDYQTDSQTLSSYWEGFHDPHSSIKTYYVSIGTCEDCEDILTNQDVGISYNFTLCHMHLGQGIRYYTTITACNTADLCTSVTSDGVIIDNSPPTEGIVIDGVDTLDIEYQPLRNYISAHWYGFMDPQSGLDRFSWRAGTKPGLDDIVATRHLPISGMFVEPDLAHQLPTGSRVYVTIKAYNRAGLSCEATSNGFLVDDSPPVFAVKPYLSRDLGSIKENSIVFRNTLKVKWEVEDDESFIQRQFLSISSHKGGHFNTSSTEINGIVREYTFTRLDLHDGGDYTVKLIVCNGAKMCVEDQSNGITVDASPPTPGMFAIHTDHAANLHRHVDGWMTWSRYKLWLSWLGFADLHTGIDSYFVSVGSTFMTDDLNKVTGSPQQFYHNQSGVDRNDEGFVQIFEVETKNLAKLEHVFVSVWAENGVGLTSMKIHSQLKLIPGGSLDLIRRCSAITCKGHCACAAQGQRCPLNGNICKDLTKCNVNNLLGVYDVTDVRPNSQYSDVKYSPSNVAMAAKWHVAQAQGLQPLWYEWTAGLTKSTTIEGVFDSNDMVWHHAGQTNQAILNLKQGKKLKEPKVGYSMTIRAWYNDDTFADFKTDGVMVISTPLSRRKIKESAVVEQIPGHWKKDIDYIRPGAPFTIRWDNVFKDSADIIEKFKVYLSTYPGGHDIHAAELDLPGTTTSYNISRVPLTPGIMFYSNVVGYSLSGIHATESSDGIMVDAMPPTAGIVEDGIGIHEIDYQNSTGFASASWHGFSDRNSGIAYYMWCVQHKDKNCDVRDWERVGVHRSVSRTLNNSNLNTGDEIENLVYAIDAIGHKSKISKSNGLLIDTTHPEPSYMEHLERNVAINPSFEDTDYSPIDWENIIVSNLCNGSLSSLPKHWNISFGSCVIVFRSSKNIAMDGRSFVFVKGEIYQMLVNLKVNQLYRVTFVTVHPPLLGAVLANKEGYVEIAGKRHVFMVYTRSDKHGSTVQDVDWHHHTFYFRSYTPEVEIYLGSMTGKTGILFDDLQVQETVLHENSDNSEQGKHVHAHVISLHQWSSIHASWSFVDPDSPIVDYMWAIGYTEGSTEIQGFTSVGLSNFAYNYNVTLDHTSIIHITVIATNAAGLRREANAEDLLVDLTPPDILFMNDGIGSDLAAQTTDEISANWDVEDPESGIEVCEWAIGFQPFGNEIQSFEKLSEGLKSSSKVFPSNLVQMQMIHVTLRCKNNAGLQSTLSSDGVKISNLPPKTSHAEIELMPRSLTEYNSRGHYQGDSSTLRLKWTGFEDLTGFDSYLMTFSGTDKTNDVTKYLTIEEQDTGYCVVSGLDLAGGNYTTSIKAVNKMYLRSLPLEAIIVVSATSPQLTDNPNLKLTIDNRTMTATWKDHFISDQPLFYEVSAGTTFGGADIIQWQETKNTFLEFILPPKIMIVNGITSYVTIRGVSANGMTAVLNAAIKLV